MSALKMATLAIVKVRNPTIYNINNTLVTHYNQWPMSYPQFEVVWSEVGFERGKSWPWYLCLSLVCWLVIGGIIGNLSDDSPTHADYITLQ